MNQKYMMMALACGVAMSVSEALAVEAPSLEKGAVITIQGGMPSSTRILHFQQKYNKNPEPYNLTLVIPETLTLNKASFFLSDTGLTPANTLDNDAVQYLAYAPANHEATLAADYQTQAGGEVTTYYFRSADCSETDLANGQGTAAVITVQQQEGNTYHGVIQGALYCDESGSPTLHFSNSPISITVPAEGESIQDVLAKVQANPPAATVAEATPESAAEESDPVADAVIQNRMAILVSRPLNEKLMRTVFADKIASLGSSKIVTRQQLIRSMRGITKTWPLRKASFLAAGKQENTIELIISYSVRDAKGKGYECYGKIVMRLDDSGKIDGMSETFTDDQPALSPGVKPISYGGKTSF